MNSISAAPLCVLPKSVSASSINHLKKKKKREGIPKVSVELDGYTRLLENPVPMIPYDTAITKGLYQYQLLRSSSLFIYI